MSDAYEIEFFTNIYVRIPVEANSRKEAEALADKTLTRHSVYADLSDDMPEGTDVNIDTKGWELNRDDSGEDDEDDEDD